MDNKTKFLDRIFNKQKDQYGDTHYVTDYVQSMEFVGYMNMDKEEYIQLLKDMEQECLITINYAGRNDITQAGIKGTPRGATYLMDNGKNKIGF